MKCKMKRNNIKYLLLFLVICIWGGVIYKFFEYRGGDNEISLNEKKVDFKLASNLSDTFSLLLNYDDPFKYSRMQVVTKKDLGSRITIEKKVKVEVNDVKLIWPNIKYSGVVFNERMSRNSVLLMINGKMYIVQNGDEILGVKIISIKRDSIDLKMLNQHRYYKIYEK